MAPRFSKQDFVELGLDVLKHEGRKGLTLEAICARAGKTRGSFYHHFGDVDDFVRAILLYWQERDTEAVIGTVANLSEPAQAQRRLTEIALGLDHRAELNIRHLAHDVPFAAEIVRAVDARRIEFLRQLHQRVLGVDAHTAEAIARLEYAAFVGARMIWPDARAEDLAALGRLFDGLSGTLQSREAGP